MGERLTGSKVHSCLSGVGEQDEKILITNPELALSLKGWEGYTSYPGGPGRTDLLKKRLSTEDLGG